MKGRGFHISVGTGLEDAYDPAVLGCVSLEHDLRLVKAALLYADDVTLYSPAASMLLSMDGVKKLRPDEKIEFLESFIPYGVTDEQAAAQLREGLRLYRLAQRHHRTMRQAREFLDLIDRAFDWEQIYETVERQMQESQASALVRAIKSGRLHVYDFSKVRGRSRAQTAAELIGQAGIDAARRRSSRWGDDLIEEYVRRLSMAVSSGATYPLFDAEAGGLVSAGVQEGIITVSEAGISRGRHSGLAADLIERLPLFEQATVDEVLDIRRELSQSLARFRKAITDFSGSIKTAPWDEDFLTEVDTIFYGKVAPAVQEIEEMVQSNRYLLLLLKRIGIPSAGALTAVMSRIADLPEIVAHVVNHPAAAHAVTPAVVSGVGVATAKALRDAAWEKHDNQRAIERRELYFYYRAKQRLS